MGDRGYLSSFPVLNYINHLLTNKKRYNEKTVVSFSYWFFIRCSL
jgi:hypothetical protein